MWTGTRVRRVRYREPPEGVFLGSPRGTCQIADDDQPGGDPDTRLQPFRRGQRSNRLDQGEAGAHRQ
jgi:hypothetical protein